MADKIFHTRGIVLRTVKYGDTSIITAIYTELFGLQSYIINGIRSSSKKGGNKAVFFQPGAILEMEVYHNELKQLQRIKEYKWGYLYQHLFTDVKKNAVALFIVELLSKCLKQPESNADLYVFTEDVLQHLDRGSAAVVANCSLFFGFQLPYFFGFRCLCNYTREANVILDYYEGKFVASLPVHEYYLQGEYAAAAAALLSLNHTQGLEEMVLNQAFRREMLLHIEAYYALHLADFGTLKTLPVLRTFFD